MSRRRRRRPNLTGQQPDVRAIVREEVAELKKALALPAGTQTTELSSGYLWQLQQRGNPRISGDAALARDPYSTVNFGPGEPLFPAPLDPALPSGRPAPRRWEYPVSWNLQTTTTRAVPWTVLRDAADQVSVMRACIEVNKSALTGLEWSFGIDSARARHLAKQHGTSSHAITADLQDKYADDLDRLHKWWQKPDRINHWTFSEWLGALLEDQLVLDAVALYPHLTLGGELHSLELLDASTIKPLLDRRGATPLPPLAAYQQILWGFPRGDYAASPSDQVDAEFTSAVYGRPTGPYAPTDSLIYKVRNRRSRGPYGFSCVEQALADIDLWMKRWDWLRAEYTAGVTPEMIIKVDSTMTPEQLKQYEAVFNDELSGRTQERHRARFLPAGFDPLTPNNMNAKFSSDLDLHLIRLICAAFNVLPTSLGFTPNHGMGGMGGQGHQQGEQDTQLQRGARPTAQWLTDLVNEVSAQWLGMPDVITFQLHGLDEEDQQKEATLLEGYVNNGLMTLNEGRDQLNLPRYTMRQADEPLFTTPTGPAFVNPDVQPVGLPGNLPSVANQPPQEQEEEEEEEQEERDEQVHSTPATEGGAEAKAEQKAFMSIVTRRARQDAPAPWRDFVFKANPPDVAEAANRLAAEGNAAAVKALFEIAEG